MAKYKNPRVGSPAVALDDAAAVCEVDPERVQSWTDEGLLPAHQVPPVAAKKSDGRQWVLRSDVEALDRGESLTPPAESHDDLRRVYAIELEDCPRRAHRGKTCIYVGQSWHPPRARFLQHLLGYKAGRKHVTKWGVRLRPDLYGQVPVSRDSAEAERRERALAQRLADDGYMIHGVPVRASG